jgi:hypothetical protein
MQAHLSGSNNRGEYLLLIGLAARMTLAIHVWFQIGFESSWTVRHRDWLTRTFSTIKCHVHKAKRIMTPIIASLPHPCNILPEPPLSPTSHCHALGLKTREPKAKQHRAELNISHAELNISKESISHSTCIIRPGYNNCTLPWSVSLTIPAALYHTQGSVLLQLSSISDSTRAHHGSGPDDATATHCCRFSHTQLPQWLQLLLLLPPKGVHECDALHLHSCCLTLLLLLPASRLHECDVVSLE